MPMPENNDKPKVKSVRTRPANVIRAIVLGAAAAAAPALSGCPGEPDYGAPMPDATQEDAGDGDVVPADTAYGVPDGSDVMEVTPPYGVPDGVDYGVPDGTDPDATTDEGTPDAIPPYGVPDGGEPEYGTDYGVPKPPAR